MTRLLFIATTFLSAFLLFLVQPLVGRLLLPVLGGSAQVWTGCLVFFQSALLAGYAVAHGLSKLPPKASRAAQTLLLAAGLITLPIASSAQFEPPRDDLTLWLLGTLAGLVGLPFVVIAGNAPSLQRWFRSTGDHARENPYFLYSASNVGSLLGLFAYPLILEPFFTLTTQRWAWSIGYLVLVVLVAGCSLVAPLAITQEREPETGGAAAVPVAVPQVARWVALAFVPSSLTVGVTSYVSTELAPIPLLWVVPLGLYLLTFIRAFAGRTMSAGSRGVRLAAMVAFPVAVWHSTLTAPTWAVILLHFGAFFVIASLCHSRLYEERPDARHLTGFFLWVALGGALGGTFNGLLAPAVFNTAAEYPLVLIVSAALLPVPLQSLANLADRWLPRIVAFVAVGWVLTTNAPNPSLALWVPAGQIARVGLRNPRIRAVAAMAVALLFVKAAGDSADERSFVARSFFAVHRVVENYYPGYRALIHGATLHGMQATDPVLPLTPVTYFAREGPIGEVFATLSDRLRDADVAVIGLGAGELASYARPGQHWTFFEIDPVVETIARERFTYLPRASAPTRVVLGDGRLELSRASGSFDLLVIDAFSSDAIPVHLITVEAFASYRERLREGSVIAMNISNRFVDLERPLARLARAAGLAGLIRLDTPAVSTPQAPGRLASSWVVLSADADALAKLASGGRWQPLQSDDRPAWTDEQADLLRSIRWRAVGALSVR